MWITICFILHVASSQAPTEYCEPYGVRAALGYYYTFSGNQSDMLDISFNTNDTCSSSYIMIKQTNSSVQAIMVNTSQLSLNISGLNWTYTPFIQRAQIGDLIPGQEYEYTVYGNNSEPSGPYQIRLPKKIQGSNESKKIIFFGDMDANWYNNNRSQYVFEWFVNQTKENRSDYDISIFTGDMAYDLETDQCQRGDYFLRNISTFTPYWPLMVSPGNHDVGADFRYTMYKKIFFTPDQTELNTDKYFINAYSFDLGLAHFVSYNPFWLVNKWATRDSKIIVEVTEIELNAMRVDLQKAQNNRDQVPWIIVFTHYPMYCSGYQDPECYENFQQLALFEDLFNEFKVDLYMSGHQHSYERDAPTFRNKTSKYLQTKGDVNENFLTSPSSPVYIVNGAGGNAYYMPSEAYPEAQYTVAQSVNPGVGVLNVLNRTHLYYEQIAAQTGNTDDFFYIIKNDDTSSRLGQVWIGLGVIAGLLTMGIIAGLIYYIRRNHKNPSKAGSLRENSLQNCEE